MSKPTVTREQLRRAISLELKMEFPRRYPDGYLTCDATSTVDKIIASELAQEDGFWSGGWWYCNGDTTTTSLLLDEVRQIDAFNANEDSLFLEYALPSTPSTTTQFEIHNIFNAIEIHQAIDRAIQTAFPHFFDIIEDETLVYQEDVLSYSLASLTYAPWLVSEVYIEQPSDSLTGTATASSNTSITDSSADFSNVAAGWLVSIYDGTGKSQLRTVTSVTGTTQLNVATWTTNPDTTSKYRVWDPNEEDYQWFRVTDAYFDSKEYPSYLYLRHSKWTSAYGARIRLVYAAPASSLTTDASTTVVPKEYVINKAIEILATSRIGDTRADSAKYASMAKFYGDAALRYAVSHAFRLETTLWQERSAGYPSSIGDPDPLAWSN